MRIEVTLPESAKPGQHGVYVAFDGDGEVLYIGRTMDLFRRLQGHRSQSAWFKQMRSIEFTPCDGPNEARVVEKSMISTFRPASNINDAAPQQFSKRQSLPDWTVAKLVTLHEACIGKPRDGIENQRLNNYILALREGGWTLAAIGCGLSFTREGVRLRAQRADKADASLGVPVPPRREPKAKKVWPAIPADKLAELLSEQPDAQRVNGPTPLDSPLRVASERYTELIAEQYLSGVSIYRIAKQLGVTHLAIRARLSRHGYMGEVKGLPQPKYGTPWSRSLQAECRRGHALSGDNLRLINGDPKRRVCRACDRMRRDKYLAKKAVA